MKKKILFVFGTRPEAIKLAPLVLALKSAKDFSVLVCITSQHKQMLSPVMDFFRIREDFDLKIMKHDQDLFDITSNVLLGLRDILRRVKPDTVIVQGDTTSAFAAALAAFYEKIPVAHVEAGLRTNNKYLPFPEEINRCLVSSLADLHFAPTSGAKDNLLAEGIDPKKVFITGNTGIDALFYTVKKVKKTVPVFLKKIYLANKNKKLILVTGHRRESFGKPFKDMCAALRRIALDHPECFIVYPVHLNPNVRKPVYDILKGINNAYLLDPLGYADFVWLINASYLIITDSGGIQEEAPSLGKPILVMREVTERPEGVAAGAVKLVGTKKENIISAAEKLLAGGNQYKNMSIKSYVYGDGKACLRIKNILKGKA